MKTILSIDDLHANQVAIKAVMERYLPDYKVLTALSGKEGIELARKEQLDTILLDIAMPHMDGFEVCKRLKEEESTKHIPVVMISAIEIDTKSRIRGLETGADAFLSKPIDPGELTAHVKVMLRIKEAEDKLRLEKLSLQQKIQERTKELKDEAERFRELSDTLPQIIYEHDVNGNITFINKMGIGLLGYSQKDFEKGFQVLNTLIPEDRDRINKNVEKLLSEEREEKVTNSEYTALRKDGRTFPVLIYSSTILRDNKTVGVRGVMVDITKRKKAEDALKESEESYRNFLENNEAIILFFSPETGRIIFVNNSAVKFYGWEKEKLLQMNINQVNILPPEEIKLKIAEAKTRKQNYFVVKHRQANCSVRDVEVYQSKLQLKNEEVVALIIHDITEHKQAENALRESNERFRAVTQSANDAIITINSKGIVLGWNRGAEKIFGYENEEISGKNLSIIIPEQDGQQAIKDFERTTQSENQYIKGKIVELHGLHKNGRTFPIELSLAAWETTSGKFFTGSIRDITERMHAEQELIKAKKQAEESDRLKSAFLANMNHEIRTPLNGILGFAELLREPNLSGGEQQEYISVINKSGARMLDTITEIVDISKIEAGLMEVDIKELNVNKQIEYTYDLFKLEVEDKGMQLFFKNSLPEKEAIIKTDHEKIYGILTKLVKNAIKYSEKGSIEFGYEKKGGFLEFFVKDTGIGIPKDRQEAIFERFIQADIADKMAYQGTGLGLTIAKAYVQMLGGEIRVESDPDSKSGKIGSTFYFTIPYKTEP